MDAEARASTALRGIYVPVRLLRRHVGVDEERARDVVVRREAEGAEEDAADFFRLSRICSAFWQYSASRSSRLT